MTDALDRSLYALVDNKRNGTTIFREQSAKALLWPSKQRATPPSPPQTVMAISASSLQQERPV